MDAPSNVRRRGRGGHSGLTTPAALLKEMPCTEFALKDEKWQASKVGAYCKDTLGEAESLLKLEGC